MSDVHADLAAAADAVTGPGTPDTVKVTRPATGAIWAVFAGMGATNVLSLLFGGAILFGGWADTPAATQQRLWYLGWALLICVGCNGLFALALASPWVGKVSAQAAGNSLSIEGR